MGESFSEAGKSAFGDISFIISTSNVQVAKELCCTADKLDAIYAGYPLLRPLIEAAVTKVLGGERDEQNVQDFRPGSLHVLLRCFTDDRFFEVLKDYESGGIKERFQKEFSQIGIKVEGLEIVIENMEEVSRTKAAINTSYKANFTRLSKLLVDKGTEALRNTLDTLHPPANLPAVINANRKSLLSLKFKVINDHQWELLFPPSGNPHDSKTFDVTLLTVLLRNVCGLPLPATGWNTMPPDTDRSSQANITKIKLFRNQVYAHVSSTQVGKATFENLWQKISQALVDLNIPQKEIDDLKTCPLGTEEEIYVQRLKEWFLKDEDSKHILDDIRTDIKSMQQQLIQSDLQRQDDRESLKTCMQYVTQIKEENGSLRQNKNDDEVLHQLAKHNFKSIRESKIKSFQPGTRDWLLNKIENWFTTEDESRLLLITAGPGFGKSVFAAKVCELFKEKKKLAACHFCDFNDSNLKDPKMMLQSLGRHMCENVPGFKEKLLDQLKQPHKVNSLKDAFQIYLQNPLDELEVEPTLIVIDALDESATDDKSDMVKLIADYFPDLPKCVKVLVTSRPELSLQTLEHIQVIEIDEKNQKNGLDLLEYLKVCLPSLAARDALNVSTQTHHLFGQPTTFGSYFSNPPLTSSILPASLDALTQTHNLFGQPTTFGSYYSNPPLTSSIRPPSLNALTQTHHLFGKPIILPAIVRKCEGSFLYAFHVQNELRKREDLDRIPFEEIMSFLPAGMGSVYKKYFHRLEKELEVVMKEKPDLVKLLELLVAANKSLPLKFIAWALDLNHDCLETNRIIQKVNEAVSCLLYVSNDVVTVFHKSVYDWLLANGYDDHEYTVKVSDGKRRLWLLCEQIFDKIKKDVSSLLDLKPMNVDQKHALAYGHEYLVESNMADSFSWLVDMVIVHVQSAVHPKSAHHLQNVLKKILQSDVAISLKLRQRISWHLLKVCYLGNFNQHFSYLKNVLDYSPEGLFTDDEKKIAKALITKVSPYVKRISGRAKTASLPLAKLFPSVISAVGVSSNKKLTAVAFKDGTICVLSLPDLVNLWQYSTEYEGISCCTFAPDGSYVLYGKLETALNIAEKKEVSFFKGKGETFKSCAFSPSGNRLVTNDGSSCVKLWDVIRQCLLTVLCAETCLDFCGFSNTGLFIIADEKNAKKDAYCVWNAITFQRVDQRSLFVAKLKNRGGVPKSERCNRCLWQQFKELFPSKLVTGPFERRGIYNEVDCIILLYSKPLRAIECTHFTTLAIWEFGIRDVEKVQWLPRQKFIPNLLPFCHITAVEDDLWLCADKRKLIVFSTMRLKEDQSCLSHLSPTYVLWCSFSPDGTRLASCTLDGYINIWNVDICRVYQRFRDNDGTLAVACWWSDTYLFVCHIIDGVVSLSKYPVDKNFKIIIVCGQRVTICTEKRFLLMSRILDFSEGYLLFRCGTDYVNVLDANRIEHQINVLPGYEPFMETAVSDDGSFVLGAGAKCIIWKRNKAHPIVYEVFVSFDFGTFPCFAFKRMWCFSNDSKFAVACFPGVRKLHFVVINLHTRTVLTHEIKVIDDLSTGLLKLFSVDTVVILVSKRGAEIVDLETCERLWFSYQDNIYIDGVIHSKLSPKGSVLAVPDSFGYMDFFQLPIPKYFYESIDEKMVKKRRIDLLSLPDGGNVSFGKRTKVYSI